MFDKEIAGLNSEIRALKSWSQKTSEQLRTVSKRVSVELTLYDDLGMLRSTQTAWVIITPETNVVPLISANLDVDSLEQRNIFYVGSEFPDGTFRQELFITGTDNPSDAVGTKLHYDLVFTATCDFDYEVVYEDY